MVIVGIATLPDALIVGVADEAGVSRLTPGRRSQFDGAAKVLGAPPERN